MIYDTGIEEAAGDLARLIGSALGRPVPAGTGLLFSGGLDSALLAHMMAGGTGMDLHVIGTEGCSDIERAISAAGILGLEEHLDIITLTPGDVAASLARVKGIHGITDPKYFSTFVCFDLALERAASGVLVCGQGADEIFGGYRKYQDMPPDLAAARMAADLEALRDREFPLCRRMAAYHGKELLAPYLEPDIVGYALALPPEWRSSGGAKLILRRAAEALGLPPEVARRPKKAMQYGSGVSREIKRMARRHDGAA